MTERTISQPDPLQLAVGELLRTAANDPLPILGPPPSLEKFCQQLDEEHLLLIVVEWSQAHKAMTYHASIARDRTRKKPAIEVAMATLMAMEGFLGAPCFYAYADKTCHWHWLVEGPGVETPSRVDS